MRSTTRTTLARRVGVTTLVAAGLLTAGPLAATANAEIVTDDPALVGLYGAQDPTNPQAVFRQSLAILALIAAGEDPDPRAVAWLEDQQCADGSYMGYAVDAACTPQGFDAPESNSTAIASMALRSVGNDVAADAAFDFLADVQDASGGFEFQPGFGADANSTGLGVSALLAGGVDPSSFNGADAFAGLGALQADCTYPAVDQGGFVVTFVNPPVSDLYATSQALTAAAGDFLPVIGPDAASWDDGVTPVDCAGAGVGADGDPLAAAAWIAAQPLASFGTSFDPVSARAFSIMGLAASGVGETRARELFADMQADLATAVGQDGADSPGRLALYILAAVALGEDPSYGDADLVARLIDTLNVAPAPAPTPTPTPVPGTNGGVGSVDADADNGNGSLAFGGVQPATLPLAASGAVLLLLGTLLVVTTRRPAREHVR